MKCFDVFDFCRKKKTLSGEVQISDLPTLCQCLCSTEGTLTFEFTGLGEQHGYPIGHLGVTGVIQVPCSECLDPVELTLMIGFDYLFVPSEEVANSIDIDEDEEGTEVTVGSTNYDLRDLIAEEAILTIPSYITHEECESRSPWFKNEEPSQEYQRAMQERPNPFAVLKDLK